MKKKHSAVIAALLFAQTASVGLCFADEAGAPVPSASVGAALAPPASDLPGLRGVLAVPVVQEPDSAALDRSKGQQWHRLTMRITGSMCPACLMELEGKIKQMPGVAFVKIDRAAPTASRASAAENSPAAVGAAPAPPVVGAHDEKDEHKHGGTPRSVGTVIVFDAKEMSADALNQLIKRELYKPMDVKETEK